MMTPPFRNAPARGRATPPPSDWARWRAYGCEKRVDATAYRRLSSNGGPPPNPKSKAGKRRLALNMYDGRARLAKLCQTVVGVCQPALQSISAESTTVREPNGTSLGAIPTAMGAMTRLAYARARQAGVALEPLLAKASLTE